MKRINMSKEKMYILTDGFPYGKGEKTFILPEIERLRKWYEITLISTASQQLTLQEELTTKLSGDIKIVRFSHAEENKIIFYAYFLLFWTKRICWSEVREIIETRKKIILRIWKSMHFFARAESLYHWLRKKNVISPEKGIYYSYWYNDKVLAMTMHKDKYPNLKVITRAHGYDLFDERQKKTLRQPFKRVMDDKLDKVIFISIYNRNYYLRKVAKKNSEKYPVYRIGSLEAAKFPKVVDRQVVFRIVSCSNLIKLKRVTLIIDALSSISDLHLEWVHFGSGSEETKIRKYAEERLRTRDNIRYDFRGYVPRNVIYGYYESTFVHCFINVSESEGSPVSMQEALAFGIPVIGTDVGGVSEMIDGNGYLLNTNPDAKEIADKIKMMAGLNDDAYTDMRNASLQIWKRDYNQINNAERFCKFLLTI